LCFVAIVCVLFKIWPVIPLDDRIAKSRT
jgi:hypothetical protein